MATRTALITGALGQDGTLLSEHLAAQGYRVIGLVREAAQLVERRQSGVELVTTDLCDRTAVAQLLERCQPDEIYHLAAYHHSAQDNRRGASLAAKRLTLDTNFRITETLAFAILEAGAKSSLVFAGSSQMYTAVGAEDLVNEQTPRRPSTFYGHVKTWGAELLAQLRADLGLRASTAILFNHESPLRGGKFVSRKITQAAAAIRAGQTMELEIGNTGARVDWCSAKDAVRALHLMATAPVARDYVIASGALHSVEDLLQTAFSHCGLDWRKHTKAQVARVDPALCGDPKLIETTLGWRRSVSFEQMIREMVDHDMKLCSISSNRGLSAG
jgi:GDPmannose 4,6-dehydratase